MVVEGQSRRTRSEEDSIRKQHRVIHRAALTEATHDRDRDRRVVQSLSFGPMVMENKIKRKMR